MPTRLEVCVDTIACAIAATDAGADRLELCAALSEGGLTPSLGLMKAAAQLPVPVYAMIRPRAGGFQYSSDEFEMMKADISAAKSAGLAGVVFGVLKADSMLDISKNAALIAHATPMKCTLHRAFDDVSDPMRALEQAIDLGFERILTSGQQPSAPIGVDLIAALIKTADGRISIMPGAGITVENVTGILEKTGANEVHGSCSKTITGTGMFDREPRKIADESMIAAMVAILS